jgi:hypothetical protein
MNKLRVLLVLFVAAPGWASGRRDSATNCTRDEQAAIDTALPAAKSRVFSVQQTFAEIAPPGPDGSNYLAESRKRDLDVLGRTIFGADYEKTDVDYYIRGMRDVLLAKPVIACSTGADAHCGGRDGYVMTGQRTIHVCPNFFNSNTGGTAVDRSAPAAEQRVRTLVHESAHVAGISEHDGKESYCAFFTCDASCGAGANVADNWSQWVHCGSGQAPDQLQAITASPRHP